MVIVISRAYATWDVIKIAAESWENIHFLYILLINIHSYSVVLSGEAVASIAERQGMGQHTVGLPLTPEADSEPKSESC